MTETKKLRVAFIGLGAMGYPMAGHLARAGQDVCVFNRSPDKAERWVAEYGGCRASTPAEVAAGAAFVFTCVGNDHDVHQVALGDQGAYQGMDRGAVFVDHTTTSADLARELAAEADARGFSFLDAPVSGGQAGAEQGVLTIMTGGDRAAFDRAQLVMAHYARAVTRMGPAGAGQLTKMVNQICIAGLVQSLSEGIAFAQNAGLDANKVIDVISKGAAQSWQMENRSGTMIDDRFEFGFAVDWMRKDLGLCLEEAGRNGSVLPVAALVDQFYAEVQKRGGRRWDTSSLVRLLR
ncbi:MAG: NAD(P)-dependent oxidoreductase [Pseudomonadota bacterium]|nr:NAD(P)-dependent oxidoreductase [Pseudomonadota bacterium]